MIRKQEITKWKPDHKMGWLYFKGQRIQIHHSQLPNVPTKKTTTDFTKHIIEFDTDDIGFQLVACKSRKNGCSVRTLNKILDLLPPRMAKSA